MKVTNVLTIVLICLALVLLIFGILINQYKVYDMPDSKDEGKLSTFTTMSEPQLLEETCYDGVTTDEAGNLINKQREAACLT